MNRPYCVLPWYHVTSHTDGKSSPCCGWKGIQSQSRLNQFFNGHELATLRQQMMDHKPPIGCIDCLDHEKRGTFSARDDGWSIYSGLLGNKEFDPTPKLEFIEINFSNICNLKCRMCGNDRSSKWTADAQEMGFHVYGKLESDVTITDEMLSTLRFVRILGGEPLLHEDRIIDMLERLRGMGRIGQFMIGITTNGMVMPGARLMSLLSECLNVFWTVSIDAHGELNDYIRTGSDWGVVTAHLDAIDAVSRSSRGWSLNIGTTCMVLNANRMEELPLWLDDRYPGIDGNHYWYPCNFPEYLAPNRLPGDWLRELADRYEGMSGGGPSRHERWWKPLAYYLRQAAESGTYLDRHPEYHRYSGPSLQLISKLDNLRSENLRAVNPEAWDRLASIS